MRRRVMNTADEYLLKVRELNELIDVKLERIEELKEDLLSVGSLDYTKEKVQGDRKAGIDDIISDIDDINAEVDELIDKMHAHKETIYGQISTMPEQYKTFLELYYIEMLSKDKIAEEMGIESKKDIDNLHDYSLLSFYTIYMK